MLAAMDICFGLFMPPQYGIPNIESQVFIEYQNDDVTKI